jgi:hypothetical protein
MERRLLQFVPEPVAQQDLEMLVAMENQIRSLEQTRDEECNKIIDRLIRGTGIEPGRHSVELRSQAQGAASVFRLVLNGRLIR